MSVAAPEIVVSLETLPPPTSPYVTADYWNQELVGFAPHQTGTARRIKQGDIIWDPNNTTIRRARIHGRILCGAGSIGTIQFNGVPSHYCDATLYDSSIDDEVEVALKNGLNNCEILLTKQVALEVFGTFWADLIIEYSGTAPVISPIVEVTPIAVPWYVWVGVVIAGAVVVGGVIYYYKPSVPRRAYKYVRRTTPKIKRGVKKVTPKIKRGVKKVATRLKRKKK